MLFAWPNPALPPYVASRGRIHQHFFGRVSALATLMSVVATLGCTATVTSRACPVGGGVGSIDSGAAHDDRCATVYKTRGGGIVIGRAHVTVGWMDELVVKLPDPSACHVVIVVERAADFDAVVNIVNGVGGSLSDLCLIQGGNAK